jgi:anaerobic selenocysteine-containing dehydrogenase
LQVTYHPDRIKTPLARSGARGSGQFKEITWDEALKQLVSQLSALQVGKESDRLALLTSPLRGERRTVLNNFATGFKSSPPIEFEFFDNRVVQSANLQSFGYASLPTVDLGQSNYVISFGADFLGTWNSPVAQSIGYGHMRKGRPGQRAKFVQIESRVSQTGASADEFIPCPPGAEGMFALSLAHVILRDKLCPTGAAGHAGPLIDGWSQGLPDYAPEKIEKQLGVSVATITRIAHEAAATMPAVVLIGDAAIAQTNGLFSALAVNALNALLGSVGKPGGISFSTTWNVGPASSGATKSSADSVQKLAAQLQSSPDAARVLLLFNANPVFATPVAWGVREALEKIPFIASFGSFIDETSALSDLILPDHSPLESWLDDVPASGSARTVVSLAPPAMNPLHDTRSMPDVLLDLAHQLGGDLAKALPWKTYDDALKATFTTLHKEKGSQTAKDPDEFWKKAKEQGGWWSADEKVSAPAAGKSSGSPAKNIAPQFDGAPEEFPFHFLPFASQMFYDGSLAHLPWMQEAPDPLSTIMWGTWIEINPRTAERLGIQHGDSVEVTSQHGKLQAPALVSPTIAPDVIAMPVGQGHENFTRYASGRGANPISILAPMKDSETGSLAWAATRVKLARVGEGKIAMFGASLTEQSPELKHR